MTLRMSKIELDDKDIEFLKNLAHEIETQNNRGTAAPYYYSVRQKKTIRGLDAGYSDNTEYVRMDGNDYDAYGSKQAAINQLIKEGMTPEEADRYFDKWFSEFGYLEGHEDHNVFLTHKGYLQHMRLNGHNYSHGIDDDKYCEEDDKKGVGGVHSYIHHAFRNPEMKQLIEIIVKIGKQK